MKQVFNKEEEGYDVQLYFGRETKMLQLIKHPHCVRFLGVGVNDDDDLYLVTEFVAVRRRVDSPTPFAHVFFYYYFFFSFFFFSFRFYHARAVTCAGR